jgi:hypothetical protein
MAAAVYDFYIEQGATFYQPLVWKDSNDDPVDLTGYIARMQIRKTVKSPDPLISLTTENGRITLGGDQGTITLEIDADDTADFTTFCGVYDLEVEASDGTVTRLLEGQIEISREVTR